MRSGVSTRETTMLGVGTNKGQVKLHKLSVHGAAALVSRPISTDDKQLSSSHLITIIQSISSLLLLS